MKDRSEMHQLGGLESYGQDESFEGSVLINSEKFNSLPKEVRDKISRNSTSFLQELQEQIAIEWVKIHEVDKRKAMIDKLTSLFVSAGFDTIYVETIDNEYCSGSCYYHLPWIVVTTQKGHIKLGWRKRVINIDWSDSNINLDGNKIFKGENVTTGEKYIHAWSYEKAIEYLSKLNSGI